MLTIFAVPKAFDRESADLQRNALRSWRELSDDVQILLISDDAGVEKAAEEFGAEHVSGVAVNEFGTPLLDSAFALAEQRAIGDVLCYSNADLIFPPGIMEAIEAAKATFDRYMLVGQCEENGRLRGPDWIDYFVFPRRATIGALPPFAVGRPWWDNWMIWRARKLGLALVDLTPTVRVIHQEHGYGHVKEPSGYRWFGSEGDLNKSYLRLGQSLSIEDATHVLAPGGIRRARHSIRRRVRVRLFMYDWTVSIYRAIRAAEHFLRRWSA